MQTSVLPINTCKEIDKKIRAFVWGASANQRKIHLLDWETICRPKEEGGLGLREARTLNLAYLSKLAFTSLQKPELLWVQVLQGKYFKRVNGHLVSAHRASQSSLWKGICGVWPNMIAGTRMAIRDGRSTPFWSSRWVDSGIVLADFADTSDPEFNPLEVVADFVDDEGLWDISKLNRLLPNEAVQQVLGMSVPKDSNEVDLWVWNGEKDGHFLVRSAYNLLNAAPQMGTNELWKTIWNWVGPSRIKHFLWISGHGRLLTNSERVRRHIASDSSCDRCGNPNESATHILRDCDFATDVWRRLGFNTLLQEWNCDFKSWFQRFAVNDGALRFGITLWYLWKARNEFIFSELRETSEAIARRITAWTDIVSEALYRDARLFPAAALRSFSEIAWTPAEQGWATINTDGSVLRNPTRAAAGGIEMAWALDCRRVELQLDSRAPVALLSRDGIQDHQHTLEVMAFQELCRREWVVSIRHVYREANRAADFLANRGHVFPYGVHHFPIVDCNLNYVLLYDSLGVSNPRLIAVND
ncbi:Putative ribonuclease H protein At1g65750 [Linum perenne]